MKKIVGIILAGGYSSRMGKLKPLLLLGEKTVLKRQIDCMRDAGVSDIIVVTGHRSEEVEKEALRWGAKAVHNPRYDQGMFTSLQAGIAAAQKGDYEGFFFLPVDHTLVRPYVLKLLLQPELHYPYGIIYPTYQGKIGHPPLVSFGMAPEMLSYTGQGGAREVLARHESNALWVECGSGDILRDMDTPGDYQEVQERYLRQIPTEEECYGMLRAEKTPPGVVAHCEAVARKAVELAEKLAQKGLSINPELARCGALVHDICRVQKEHAQEGALVLRQNGFEQVAQIVAVHMEGTEQMVEEISEASLVFYADKITVGDTYVSLKQRWQDMDEKKRPFAGDKLQKAAAIEEKIKKLLI